MQATASRVNFRKLVRDLADMYADDPFDVVVTELVANALDAKAKTISIAWNSQKQILVIEDDGAGMSAEDFREYHDLAVEAKNRGNGIGFAGIGAKISFNIAHQVMTESRKDGESNASNWRWHEDELKWEPISTRHLHANGTRVEVYFKANKEFPRVTRDYIVGILNRHYLPLFVEEFLRSYDAIGMYPADLQFLVDGSPIQRSQFRDAVAVEQSEPIALESGGKRSGWGALGLSNEPGPIGLEDSGVRLCTYGKVVKREMLGQSMTPQGARLFGIVEIPALIDFLTTTKSDLQRGPGKTQRLNAILAPVTEQLKRFLAKQGLNMPDQKRNVLSAKLERELSKMISDLPELQDFSSALRKSRSLRKNNHGNILTTETARENTDDDQQVEPNTDDKPDDRDSDSNLETSSSTGHSREESSEGTTPAHRRRSRRNEGPRIAFEDHSERQETSWLDVDTVIINSGHQAYANRVTQDQAKFTYCMFAIGLALDKAGLFPLPEGENYVDKFIATWGQS